MTWFSTLLGNLSTPFKWWVTVAPWESGVRVRLGRTAKLLNPGPHFRIPFLDRVYVQSVRLRTITYSNLNAMTKAGKTVTVCVAIDFAVQDIRKLYDSLSTPETTLQALIAEKVIAFVESAESVSAAKLREHVCSSLRADDWGLSSVSVRITGFTICRSFRLIQNEYSHGARLYSLDDTENGERK